MAIVLLLVAGIVLAVCLGGKGTGKILLTVLAAVLYFPIGVILALAKKYK